MKGNDIGIEQLIDILEKHTKDGHVDSSQLIKINPKGTQPKNGLSFFKNTFPAFGNVGAFVVSDLEICGKLPTLKEQMKDKKKIAFKIKRSATSKVKVQDPLNPKKKIEKLLPAGQALHTLVEAWEAEATKISAHLDPKPVQTNLTHVVIRIAETPGKGKEVIEDPLIRITLPVVEDDKGIKSLAFTVYDGTKPIPPAKRVPNQIPCEVATFEGKPIDCSNISQFLLPGSLITGRFDFNSTCTNASGISMPNKLASYNDKEAKTCDGWIIVKPRKGKAIDMNRIILDDEFDGTEEGDNTGNEAGPGPSSSEGKPLPLPTSSTGSSAADKLDEDEKEPPAAGDDFE